MFGENTSYDLKPLEYKFRPWMIKARFMAKGIIYEILEGTWVVKGNKCYDAILFKDVKSDKMFCMDEETFFNRIDITQIKIK